ncbi:transposase domain-containing protein [Ralstonia pseudosolanacearum]|uniref:transposase domain-containing protein n=1 Tax=Ralstonia pseudosolanacearum TaxID=1310165 RepID=UPI00399D62DA
MTEEDANASANLYSQVETAKANGVDAYPYLVTLLKRQPRAQAVDDDEVRLPWRLKPSADAEPNPPSVARDVLNQLLTLNRPNFRR